MPGGNDQAHSHQIGPDHRLNEICTFHNCLLEQFIVPVLCSLNSFEVHLESNEYLDTLLVDHLLDHLLFRTSETSSNTQRPQECHSRGKPDHIHCSENEALTRTCCDIPLSTRVKRVEQIKDTPKTINF